MCPTLKRITLAAVMTAFSGILQPCPAQGRRISITETGAKPDGVTDNAAAIQRAIDEVHRAGGGVVHVPRGRYMCGVIRLRSNTELNIHPEAVLLASTDRDAYGPSLKASGWIVADSATDIAITGKGLLDGQCDLLMADIYGKLRTGRLQDPEWKRFNPWHQRRPVEANRPRMIRFSFCDSVRILDVRMQNGTSWVQDYRNCSNMTIEGIDVFSNTFLNNDGIDLTDCRKATIRNCRVNAADDGICLKSSMRDALCEDISISDCTVRSSASAVKLGTASHGGFRNIRIDGIRVYDTYRSAIAIEAVDGGIAEDIEVRNIHAVNTGNALFIRLGHRNGDPRISRLRNIRISNLYAEIPRGKPDSGYTHDGPLLRIPSGIDPETPSGGRPLWWHHGIDSTAAVIRHNVFPSSITGIPGHPVENIVIEDVTIVYEGGDAAPTLQADSEGIAGITEAVKEYPEFSMFGELPAWGLFIRHVDGLTLRNIRLSTRKPDARTPVVADDAHNVRVERLRIFPEAAAPAVILNRSGRWAWKRSSRTTVSESKGRQ